MCEFIQLSELEQCRVKQLAQGNNTAAQDSNPGPLSQASQTLHLILCALLNNRRMMNDRQRQCRQPLRHIHYTDKYNAMLRLKDKHISRRGVKTCHVSRAHVTDDLGVVGLSLSMKILTCVLSSRFPSTTIAAVNGMTAL